MASNPSWKSFAKEVAGENRTKIKNKYRIFIMFQLKIGLTRLTNIPFSLSYIARLKHTSFSICRYLNRSQIYKRTKYKSSWIFLFKLATLLYGWAFQVIWILAWNILLIPYQIKDRPSRLFDTFNFLMVFSHNT